MISNFNIPGLKIFDPIRGRICIENIRFPKPVTPNGVKFQL